MHHDSRLLFVSTIAAMTVAASQHVNATEFKIDGTHSSVVFRIDHRDISHFYGRFNEIEGVFAFDSDPAKCSIDVKIKSDSIDTNNGKRDKHLKSPDFFDVRQNPVITFKSKEMKNSENNEYLVTGELTLHGVTKPLEVTIKRMGSESGNTAGFVATFSFKRTDFGMDYMVGKGLGDEIVVMVGIEGAVE